MILVPDISNVTRPFLVNLIYLELPPQLIIRHVGHAQRMRTVGEGFAVARLHRATGKDFGDGVATALSTQSF